MKKILIMAALAALFTTSANAAYKDDVSKTVQINACVQAVSDIEKMAGSTSSYSYTDRTGRQMNINFGTLCTSLPDFDKYIEREMGSRAHQNRMKALANLLLMRSPISDKELQEYAFNFANSKQSKKDNDFSFDFKVAYQVNYYLHRYPMTQKEDEDMNILTGKHKWSYAASAPYLTRCFTGMECSTDKRYGLGNKTFQKFLLALTKRDHNKALNILLDYNIYLLDHNPRDNQVAKSIAITIDKNR